MGLWYSLNCIKARVAVILQCFECLPCGLCSNFKGKTSIQVSFQQKKKLMSSFVVFGDKCSPVPGVPWCLTANISSRVSRQQ